MFNQILFTIIGLLMLAGTSVGTVALSKEVFAGDHSKNTSNTSVETPLAQIDEKAAAEVPAPVGNSVQKTSVATSGSVAATTVVTEDCSNDFRGKDHDEDDEDEDEDEDRDDDEDRKGNCISVVTMVPATAGIAETSASASVSTPAPSAPVSAPVSKPVAQPATKAPSAYTLAEIAAHNSAASCYSAINGSVYDLSSFVSRHPGGSAAIKSLCGVDGTAAYMGQHGGSSRPANELASLKIGTVAP